MNTKTKAVIFISMLVLVFSTVACKQSGEAEKPVKADEAVSGAVEEGGNVIEEEVAVVEEGGNVIEEEVEEEEEEKE